MANELKVAENGAPARSNSPAVRYGRGGAGNTTTHDPTVNLPPKDFSTPTIKSEKFTTGRGGSGNMAPNVEANITRAIQDVDAPAHHNKDPSGTYHWGRGGEGNRMTVNSSGKEDLNKSGERPTLSGNSQGRRSSFSSKVVEKGKDLLGMNKDKN